MTTNFSEFYLRFENHFRGDRDDIKSRQRVYFPLLDMVKEFVVGEPVALDIGCGRGEWLENLREHGWRAYGRDINNAMVDNCRRLGLDVELGDALEHLRNLPAASLHVISGFHIVEHLPFELVLELFAESLRVLKPGGIVIFETPNPENLQVGGHTFYLDPTHVRPIPPALLAFAANDAGFSSAQVLRLHPLQELGLGGAMDVTTIEKHASQLSFGPQDYAIVAIKELEGFTQKQFKNCAEIVESLNMVGLLIPNTMGKELRLAQEKLVDSKDELERVQQLYVAQKNEFNQARQNITEVSRSLHESNLHVAELNRRCLILERQLVDVYASTSWRSTKVLRNVGGALRKLRGTEINVKLLTRKFVLAIVRNIYRFASNSVSLKKIGRTVLLRSPRLKKLLIPSVVLPQTTLLKSTNKSIGNQSENAEFGVHKNVLAQLGLVQVKAIAPKAIHQFVHTCAFGDGVSNGVLFTRRLLKAAGIESEIYCFNIHKSLMDQVLPFNELQSVDENALLLVHHSCGYDEEGEMLALPMPKVMIYHNITPAEFFPVTDPTHHYCKLGREQLFRWPAAFIGAIGDSELNTAELLANGYRNAETIPLLVDLQKILAHPWNPKLGEGYADTFNVLFIGRVVESKCQHELIETIRLLRAQVAVPVKLLLAGAVHSLDYFQQLEKRVEQEGLEDCVEFLGKVSEEDLYALYRCADVFVSLSGHEGFGMPLIEAMAFGVPVLACSSGNIPHTMGLGGVLLTDKRPEIVAETIALLVNEPGVRRRILQQQAESLARFDAMKLQGHLLDYLRRLGVQVAWSSDAASHPEQEKMELPWRVEGPIQGSYSLAFVNRGMARGLLADGVHVAVRSMDGGMPIPVEPDFAEKEPDIALMLERGNPGLAQVCLRDCYPPRTDGMMAEIKAIHAYGWEESAFPERFVRWFNMRLDLVTVLSTEVARSLRNSGVRLPIAVVGAGVDHHPAAIALPEGVDLGRGFRFLHISSCFPRKGVDVLLRAYGKAFRASDDVTLVIKTFPNPHNTVENDLAALRQTGPDFPRVVVISQDWSDESLNALYPVCNAFVAPSRGEGFGLPMAEAMLHGLPVITLAAGGQADFCTPETAWLCDFTYTLAQTHLNVAHSAWREPDQNDLARCLREVYEAPESVLETKKSAAKNMVENEYTWRKTAKRTDEAIQKLSRMPVLSPDLPIGWLTTWNTRCGIANYSDYLLTAFPRSRVHILANRALDLVRNDDDRVTRCWEFGEQSLQSVLDALELNRIKVLVVQYNFGFFPCSILEKLVDSARKRGIFVHLFLHSTRDVIKPEQVISLREHVPALEQVDRIYVHGLDDYNYLKQMGLDANVVLFPHGVLPAQEKMLATSELKQPGRKIIASYGFLLPHKGIKELVLAFARLSEQNPQLHLLLANALYPVEESMLLNEDLTKTIADLGIGDRVTREHDFLADEDSLALLGQADLIVFPYQHTQESSSAAVRMGLSAGCAVAVTPLPIFGDVIDAVLQLPGTSEAEIAQGILRFINDPRQLQQATENAQRYCAERAWPLVSNRLLNIIDGLAIQDTFDQA